MLKDAEKRWEVINIDSDEESAHGKESNKRRKVSVSPQANNSSSNTTASESIGQVGAPK